jgi:hypothetical protein
MFWWLVRHYYSLRKFMNIQLFPIRGLFTGLTWMVDFYIPYNKLDVKQKQLADIFCEKLKKLDRV